MREQRESVSGSVIVVFFTSGSHIITVNVLAADLKSQVFTDVRSNCRHRAPGEREFSSNWLIVLCPSALSFFCEPCRVGFTH